MKYDHKTTVQNFYIRLQGEKFKMKKECGENMKKKSNSKQIRLTDHWYSFPFQLLLL